jgi:hypothetical protein
MARRGGWRRDAGGERRLLMLPRVLPARSRWILLAAPPLAAADGLEWVPTLVGPRSRPRIRDGRRSEPPAALPPDDRGPPAPARRSGLQPDGRATGSAWRVGRLRLPASPLRRRRRRRCTRLRTVRSVLVDAELSNLSTSAALVPWGLWTLGRFVEHRSIRRGAALAVVVALTAVAGEPLSLASVGVLSIAYAAAMTREAGDTRGRLRAAIAVAGWELVGGLLAAGQIMPLLDAASRSPRATGALVDGSAAACSTRRVGARPDRGSGRAGPPSRTAPRPPACRADPSPRAPPAYPAPGSSG